MRQPEAGVQTSAPVPGSLQAWEQQVPAPAVHGSPSRVQLPPPAPASAWQTPTLPAVPEQLVLQQSLLAKQMSPVALQEYARTHTPPWQLEEQQSRPAVQALPRVKQTPLPAMGWQARPPSMLAAQVNVQQSAFTPQAALRVLQALFEQVPPRQLSEQQSVGLVQAVPAG